MLGLKLAAVLVMSGAIGVMYRIPRNVLIYGSFSGMAAWVVTYALQTTGANVVTASFCGSLAIGTLAEVLARMLRKPATVFVITGFIPLVPGREAFTTMRYLVEGQYVEAVSMGVQTMLLGGAIAFGIFVSITGYRLTLNYLIKNEIEHADNS